MDITVYRHKEHQKFIVTIDNGFSTDSIALYDVSVAEVAQFINELRKGDK